MGTIILLSKVGGEPEIFKVGALWVPDSGTGPTVPTVPAWSAQRLPEARGTAIPGSPPTGRPPELRSPGSGPRLRHGGRRLFDLAL